MTLIELTVEPAEVSPLGTAGWWKCFNLLSGSRKRENSGAAVFWNNKSEDLLLGMLSGNWTEPEQETIFRSNREHAPALHV